MSITADKLSYIYMKGTPFEKAALNNISFKIDKGEFVGIIGHTGSGKSTLIQHFNGLLKPTSGKILVNGVDTSGRNLRELRKQVGIVFQYPEHQLFEETVYKDIAFGLQKQGKNEIEAEAQIRKAINAVGLKHDILEKSPFELSGGQKRRVAIAGVLVMNPEILVLDEPAAGLDPVGRDEILAFISRLHKTMEMTIILVSHSMEDIAKHAGRIIVLNKGSVEMDGNTRDIFRDAARLESIGLKAPQVTYLFNGLRKVFPEIGDNIITVSEAKEEILRYIRRESHS